MQHSRSVSDLFGQRMDKCNTIEKVKLILNNILCAIWHSAAYFVLLTRFNEVKQSTVSKANLHMMYICIHTPKYVDHPKAEEFQELLKKFNIDFEIISGNRKAYLTALGRISINI